MVCYCIFGERRDGVVERWKQIESWMPSQVLNTQLNGANIGGRDMVKQEQRGHLIRRQGLCLLTAQTFHKTIHPH